MLVCYKTSLCCTVDMLGLASSEKVAALLMNNKGSLHSFHVIINHEI